MSTRTLRSLLRSSTILASGFMILAVTSTPAASEPGTGWTGLTSSNWFDAGNWSSSTVPTASDPVLIEVFTVNNPVIGLGTANAASVSIGGTIPGSGVLTITEGGILNTGTVNITGMPLATGTLNIGAIVGSPLAAAGTLNASNVA
ncbi:MAG TPA: hypothetical protein VHP59_24450, partial [Vineibacter terrae]|nr:hypothetical protein [Vineibacter terrae]